jgi:ubiquitin-conjugating enzyme E2 I
LLGIQELLNSPNMDDPAQSDAYMVMRDDVEAYKEKVREQARSFAQ